ncbi:MAG: tetratricopeptide repeat protein [Candidatus Omnitrophica bacterium]|nr:tetratricopeptide repeat protein [Candidatus Omnitrophota bacterium]
MKGLKSHIFFILLIIALPLIAYYGSFNNSFIWDDRAFVTENEAVKRLNPASVVSNFIDRETVASDTSLSKDVWRPLVTTSFGLDHKLWGFDARPYHVENTLFHILNALLVYAAVMAVGASSTAAFAAALIFALNPVQTEAVTLVSGRANVLFLFFFLLAFLSYAGSDKRSLGRPLLYGLSVLLFFLGLLSKEMAITLPLVLIAYDHFFRAKEERPSLLSYMPFFLVALAYLVARFSVLGTLAQRQGWWGGDMQSYLFTTLRVVFGYVRLLFLPVNLKADYMIDISRSFLEMEVVSAAVGLAFIAALYMLTRRRRQVSFYIWWFFITLLPVYNLVPFKAVMAERFLYLPSIAFAALFGMFVADLLERFRASRPVTATVRILFAAVLVLYVAGTISRNAELRNEIVFYSHELTCSPDNPRFHLNLGLAYVGEAKKYSGVKKARDLYYTLAAREFEKAVALDPSFQKASINAANAYIDLGLYDLAVRHLKKALAVEEDSRAYYNLAVASYHSGQNDKAIRYAKRALFLMPGYKEAYIALGNAYYMKGDYKRAKAAWLQAVKRGGATAEVVNIIGELEKAGY